MVKCSGIGQGLGAECNWQSEEEISRGFRESGHVSLQQGDHTQGGLTKADRNIKRALSKLDGFGTVYGEFATSVFKREVTSTQQVF